MKSEIEYKWIVNLLNSPYVKGLWGNKGGCKKDFERISGSSENNKEFSRWFASLLECGALEFHSNIKIRCKSVSTYVVIYKKLEKILTKNKLYIPSEKIMSRQHFGRDIKLLK